MVYIVPTAKHAISDKSIFDMVMHRAVASLFKGQVEDGLVNTGIWKLLRLCIDLRHHVWHAQWAWLDLWPAK